MENKWMKAMCLTEEQNIAIAELNAAFKKAVDSGVDFIYDCGILKLVAFNANGASVERLDSVKGDEYIDFEFRISEFNPESDDCFCEIGSETHFHEECCDRLVIVPKK